MMYLDLLPRGDRSVYKYENDKNLAYKNLTSGDPEAKVYELIAKGEKGLVRYEFEPDDEMLDEVMVKISAFRGKISGRNADGGRNVRVKKYYL